MSTSWAQPSSITAPLYHDCTTYTTWHEMPLLRAQPEHTQRGYAQGRRGGQPVRRFRLRVESAEVADAGAAVPAGVGVEDLDPATGPRQPDAVPLLRHGREVGHAHQARAVRAGTQERQRVVARVIADDPAEAVRCGVLRPEGGVRAV